MAKSDRRKAAEQSAASSVSAPSAGTALAPVGAIFLGGIAVRQLASERETRPTEAMDIADREIANGNKDRMSVFEKSNKPLRNSPYAGVSYGKDNRPRIELSDGPDVGVKLNPGAVPMQGSVSLDKVVDHPELYKAAPYLRDLQVTRSPHDNASSFDGQKISIAKNKFGGLGRLKPDALRHIMHEVQHAVQAREGFDPGGSPMMFHGTEAQRIAQYEKLAGENEARLTGNSLDLTARDRRQRLPNYLTGNERSHVSDGFDHSLKQQTLEANVPIKNPSPFRVEREFIDFQGVKDAASNAFQQLFNRDMADNKPARFRKLDPRQINSDPDTFQFKSGGDNHGVTDRLKGVKSWDNVAAGKAVVFERANGELVIADGHQRLGLAKRLAAEGQKVNMDAYVLRERDGWAARDVYAYAALKNIKESSGQALDMAKVMRERPDLINGSVPMSDGKVREAANLSKLSKPAFDMVVGGAIKPEVAAQVGARLGDTSRHADLLSEMAKANVGTAQHAGLYVDQALAAGSITTHQASLFGEETQTRSLIAERAAVLDKALTALKSDKRIFSLLEREAGVIEDAGNRLSHETNAVRAGEAGNQAALIERLAKNRGPVSDMLEQAARQMADGKKPQLAARGFVKSVGDALKSGGMQALTGDAPAMHHMVNQNQTDIFGVESAGHHAWDSKARLASAEVRASKAKGKAVTKKVKTEVQGPPNVVHQERIIRRNGIQHGIKMVPVKVPPKLIKAGKAAKPGKERMAMDSEAPPRLTKAQTNPESRAKWDHILDLVPSDPKEVKRQERLQGERLNKRGPLRMAIDTPPPSDPIATLKTMSKAQVAKVFETHQGYAPAKSTSKTALIKQLQGGVIENARFQNKLTAAHLTDKPVDGRAEELASINESIKKAAEPEIIRDKSGNAWRKGQDNGWSIDRSVPKEKPATSGLRGTQNAANLEAIVANKKANAKGKTGTEQRRDRAAASRAKTHEDRVASGAKKPAPGFKAMERRIPPSAIANAEQGSDFMKPDPERAAKLRAENARIDAAAKPKSAAARKADKYVAEQEARLGKAQESTLHQGAFSADTADRERRYMSRMRAGDSQKTDAELKADFAKQAGKPSVADKMRAKMSPTPATVDAGGKIKAYNERLTKALGTPDFHRVHAEIAADKSLKVGDLKALTKMFVGNAEAGKGRNLKKIESRQMALETSVAKSRATAGRIAGALAPIAIGAAMILSAKQAKAEGRSTGEQIKEAAKTGAEGAGVMAGFIAAHAGGVALASKVGITAAKAVPGVNLLMMGGNAAYEAYNAPEGHKLEAAARGAWDMSMPGMVVNTAKTVGALLPETHNVGGRGAARGPAPSFERANQAFKQSQSASAGQQTSTIADDGSKSGSVRRGWANPKVQAAAKEAQGRTFSGFTRSDLK